MKTIAMRDVAGEFAEDKDSARTVRERDLAPALKRGDTVILDFAGVRLATQSFVHALVSSLIRSQGPDVLDKIVFKNCNPSIKSLVSIVAEYSQEEL